METVTVPDSVQIGDRLMTAHWSVEAVNRTTGDIDIKVVATANSTPYIILRMDAALVRDLRRMAGFGEPSTNGSTNARMGEADDLTAVWNELAKHSGLSPLARSMYENYDAENDTSLVSYWDMQLLDMIERIGSRLMLLAGRNDDGKTSDA